MSPPRASLQPAYILLCAPEHARRRQGNAHHPPVDPRRRHLFFNKNDRLRRRVRQCRRLTDQTHRSKQSLWGKGLLRLGRNGDDDLSVSAIVPDCSTVSVRSLVQRNGGFDECSEISSVKLFSDFNQLLLIRLDDEESIF